MLAGDPNPMPDKAIFTATLNPHRSLTARGLRWVMGLTGAAGLAVSIPFYLLGAWPILGFMGLDLALIYAAFRYNNATARSYEEIVLSRALLLVRSVSWRGQVREARLNPRWTRLEKEEHPEFGVEKLALVQGAVRLEVARELGRAARADFAADFQRALVESRR